METIIYRKAPGVRGSARRRRSLSILFQPTSLGGPQSGPPSYLFSRPPWLGACKFLSAG